MRLKKLVVCCGEVAARAVPMLLLCVAQKRWSIKRYLEPTRVPRRKLEGRAHAVNCPCEPATFTPITLFRVGSEMLRVHIDTGYRKLRCILYVMTPYPRRN